MSEPENKCPLCGSQETNLFHKDRYRSYFMCSGCGLVHVPKQYHLSHEKEKHRYDLHNNDVEDEGYRRFLDKLVSPLVDRLNKGAEGLDYGSGPVPVLSEMLSERGFKMSLFDLYYAGDRGVLEKNYDFLTCCETVEHFADPEKEWKNMVGLVKKGGWMGIMTQMQESAEDFARWHYINDETHICFYSESTLKWIAGKYGMKAFFYSTSVVLFQVL